MALTRLPSGGLVAGAGERAWYIVMDGFAEALRTPGLSGQDRADLLECHRLVGQVCGRPIVSEVPREES